MTWDEFMERLAKSGIGYFGIGVDKDGYVIIHTDLKVKQDGKMERLVQVDDYAGDEDEDLLKEVDAWTADQKYREEEPK